MLLWKILGWNGDELRQGWIVAPSHAVAEDIARRENAQIVSEPIDWFPRYGARVYWLRQRD